MNTHWRAVAVFATCAAAAGAQTPDDGFMMSKKVLTTGIVYGHESWSEYWEGTLKRSNDNIGTLTTQSLTLVGHYGLTDRVTLIGMLPYVWTRASDGVMQGMNGVQDLTLAAKYRLIELPMTSRGSLSAAIVGAAAAPMTNYEPDFQPLSIGSASRRFTGRFNLQFHSAGGAWFVNGSAGHTWRNTVTLDRSSYFTNGQLYLTNEVQMPRVFDYVLGAGYRKGRLYVPVAFSEQRTLGGGDIRRQDMPFVSNRMNFRELDATAMYALNVPKAPAIRLGVSHVLDGRNVGQSTMLTTGFLYTFDFQR